jgi:hypothetical protein
MIDCSDNRGDFSYSVIYLPGVVMPSTGSSWMFRYHVLFIWKLHSCDPHYSVVCGPPLDGIMHLVIGLSPACQLNYYLYHTESLR